MNSNRSKYTYTPTYGMQKQRGLMKKSASLQVPEAPDFTQVPDPTIGAPLQQAIPQQSVQAPVAPPQGGSFMNSQPPYLGASPSAPVQPSPTLFAAPTFVQPNQVGQMPPLQTMSQQSYQPPLGNHFQPSASGYSGRTQGFVPPQQNTASNVQPAANVPPPFGWNPTPNPQQSIPPFPGATMNAAQPAQPFQPAQNLNYPPLQPIPQQPGFTVQATAPHKAPRVPSMDADKLWSLFLFGLLPLLFIPCLFVPNTWDVLRYVFIGATVVGLGVMWYRQMYNPVSRLITSVVYVALCIGTIAMLMQGVQDARQASANLGNAPQQSQATPEPAANAAVSVTATPSPEPTVSGPSEAERRLELFMELWKVNNTTEMVNLVQPSWRGQQENAAASLFLALANRTPEDFTLEEISGTETDNSRTITMRATINKNTGKAPVVYRFMVMMVKEGGEWYVNPNSLATNDAQETAPQDENVVKTQGSGTVTEPPRETVTPAPPASTPLYYNIGGNFYHMDPECPSVGKDYLPFDASFSYADLGSYNRDLLPCLSCNAPTDTLD